jgi:hypothetical protein
LGGEDYGNVRPLGLGNGAFDSYVIYYSVIVLALSLGVKIDIGSPGDCKDCAMSWEGFILLMGFLDLWKRWRRWVGFGFDLGIVVIFGWVGDDIWYHGYHVSWTRRKGTGGPTMSRRTQPKDLDQVVYNRGGLEDRHRTKSCKYDK